MPARSLDVADPPQVDIVVAEVLGNFAYEEDVLETLRDAQRFLVPGGTLIPASIEQWVAPVSTDRFERDLRSWRGVGFGLDWSDAERMSRNNMYVFAIEPKDLVEDAARSWDSLDFRGAIESRRAGSVSWRPDRARPSMASRSGGTARSRPASSSRRAPTAPARIGIRSISRCSSLWRRGPATK